MNPLIKPFPEKRLLRAPAKLNLRLKILGRRDNGFHELSMLNAPISLYDEIGIEYQEQPGVRLVGSPKELGDEKSNIVTRAASGFIERFQVKLGIVLSLKKCIPVGAGLGGGSSDAASVLSCLSTDFSDYVSVRGGRDALLDLALSLGADVPYFLFGKVAAVSGIGETVKVLELPEVLGVSLLLCSPPEALITQHMYQEYRRRFPSIPHSRDLELEKFISNPRPFPAAGKNYEYFLSLIENDFELLLECFSPGVFACLSRAREHPAFLTGLTGSGSSFFALPRSPNGLSIELENEFRCSLAPLGVKVTRVTLIEG